MINKDNFRHYCVTNEAYIKNEIRALCVEFPGLDGNSCISGRYDANGLENTFARRLGENGILLIYVFTGPWSWMNDAAVNMTDGVISAVREAFSLPPETPLLLTGGSMGGHGCLTYALFGRHKAVCCAASCPVCDLTRLLPYRNYWPATLYHAFGGKDLEKELISHSPLYRVEDMPDIPYFIVSCGRDEAVPPDVHFEPFIEKMRLLGRQVTREYLPDAGHCCHIEDTVIKMTDFLISHS